MGTDHPRQKVADSVMQLTPPRTPAGRPPEGQPHPHPHVTPAVAHHQHAPPGGVWIFFYTTFCLHCFTVEVCRRQGHPLSSLFSFTASRRHVTEKLNSVSKLIPGCLQPRAWKRAFSPLVAFQLTSGLAFVHWCTHSKIDRHAV